MLNNKGVLSHIGNTPLVDVSYLVNKPKVKFYLKLEGNNPGGSVKDRAAYNMIKSAMERRELKQGDKLVEATSGNTGIALALIASLLGIKLTIVLPENSTVERIKSMKAYGAHVVLTRKEGGIEASRDLALKMAREEGYKVLDQFSNEDNWKAHYKTTGPEIWDDTNGEITHFVSAMGTTGTIMGVSNYLKEQNPDVQIIGVQPTDESKIPGIRKWPTEYLPAIFDNSKIDKILEVSEVQAKNQTRKLALEAGLLTGMSSGGAAWAALQIAKEIDEGVVVSIVCDRGDRYLSSDLFEG
jgi:cysteine synthase B